MFIICTYDADQISLDTLTNCTTQVSLPVQIRVMDSNEHIVTQIYKWSSIFRIGICSLFAQHDSRPNNNVLIDGMLMNYYYKIIPWGTLL